MRVLERFFPQSEHGACTPGGMIGTHEVGKEIRSGRVRRDDSTSEITQVGSQRKGIGVGTSPLIPNVWDAVRVAGYLLA